MRLRFTIRDLLWLTLVVAMAVGWWLGHRRLSEPELRRISDHTYGRSATASTTFYRILTEHYPFMKIERTLAVLWLAAFIAGPCYWLWMFLHKSAPAYDGIHALESLVCMFGAIASIFLLQGAKWARISIGIIAIVFGVGALFWEILPQGWMRADKWADDATFVLSLVSVVLLFFPRHKPIAKQVAAKAD